MERAVGPVIYAPAIERRLILSLLVAFAVMASGAVAAADPTTLVGAALSADTPGEVTDRATRVSPPLRSLTVLAGGDVLTEARVRAPAAAYGAASGQRFDFRPMFAELRDVLEAVDLSICNMEIPVGRPGEAAGFVGRSPFGGNLLRAPHEVAQGLADVGFDRCSTASNHSFDVGVTGLASTIEALQGAGISTVGTARHPAEAVDQIFEVDGVRVAHLAFTNYSNTVVPAEAWRLNYTRRAGPIVAAIADVRARGAEVVMLSLHVSKELEEQPAPTDRALVTEIAALADVDAVFVHGPHVVQPVERVNGVPVWWSLGNFVSEMGPPSVGRYASPRTSDGLLAFVEFVEVAPGEFVDRPESIAICNDFSDRTVRAASVSLRRADLSPRVRLELLACAERTQRLVPNAK